MPFAIDTFRARLVEGGARQNLFEVDLTFPQAANSSVANDQISFMCKSASLPPEEIGVITVPYFGRQIKVPGDRIFPEWSITIINDEDFGLRNTFEQWSNAINGHFNNLRAANALVMSNGYAANGSILQYGKTGAVIKEYDMIGLWPSMVSNIDMSWDSNDQIEEFQVVLNYQYWSASTTQ